MRVHDGQLAEVGSKILEKRSTSTEFNGVGGRGAMNALPKLCVERACSVHRVMQISTGEGDTLFPSPAPASPATAPENLTGEL